MLHSFGSLRTHYTKCKTLVRAIETVDISSFYVLSGYLCSYSNKNILSNLFLLLLVESTKQPFHFFGHMFQPSCNPLWALAVSLLRQLWVHITFYVLHQCFYESLRAVCFDQVIHHTKNIVRECWCVFSASRTPLAGMKLFWNMMYLCPLMPQAIRDSLEVYHVTELVIVLTRKIRISGTRFTPHHHSSRASSFHLRNTHTQHRHAINNLIYFIVLLIYLFMASGMAVDGCVRL